MKLSDKLFGYFLIFIFSIMIFIMVQGLIVTIVGSFPSVNTNTFDKGSVGLLLTLKYHLPMTYTWQPAKLNFGTGVRGIDPDVMAWLKDHECKYDPESRDDCDI